MARPHLMIRSIAAALTLLVTSSCSAAEDETSSSAGPDGSGECSEIAMGPGVTDEEIRIGELNALSGPIAPFGEIYSRVTEAYFDKANQEGGVAGRELVAVPEDSGYDPQTALAAYQRIRDDVLMLASTMGTPVTEGIRQRAGEDGVTAVIGALNTFYAQDENFVIPAGTYRFDAINAVAWYMENGGQAGDKVAILHQDDLYGEDSLRGFQYAAEFYDLEIVEETSYSTADQDFTPQVTQLKNSGAEYVHVTPLANQLGPYMSTAQQLGFTPVTTGHGSNWSAALKSLPPEVFENYHPVTSIPAWGVDETAGMEDMLDTLETYAPDQEPDILVGLAYAHAIVTVEILREAAAACDLTREGVLAAAGEVSQVDTAGLMPILDYTDDPDGMKIGTRASRVYNVDFGAELGLVPDGDYFTSDAAEQDPIDNL